MDGGHDDRGSLDQWRARRDRRLRGALRAPDAPLRRSSRDAPLRRLQPDHRRRDAGRQRSRARTRMGRGLFLCLHVAARHRCGMDADRNGARWLDGDLALPFRARIARARRSALALRRSKAALTARIAATLHGSLRSAAIACALIGIAAAPPPAHPAEQLYRYRDAEGRWQFTDRRPESVEGVEVI